MIFTLTSFIDKCAKATSPTCSAVITEFMECLSALNGAALFFFIQTSCAIQLSINRLLLAPEKKCFINLFSVIKKDGNAKVK